MTFDEWWTSKIPDFRGIIQKGAVEAAWNAGYAAAIEAAKEAEKDIHTSQDVLDADRALRSGEAG